MQAFPTEKQSDVGQAEDTAKVLQLVSWLQVTLRSLLIFKCVHIPCNCRVADRKARNLVLICENKAFNLGWTQIGVNMADCVVPQFRHIASGAG